MNNAFENEKEAKTLKRLRVIYKNTSLNVCLFYSIKSHASVSPWPLESMYENR